MPRTAQNRAVLGVMMLVALTAAACGGSGSSSDDQVAWCRAGRSVAAHIDVLDPGFAGDAADTAVNLGQALSSALEVAPEAVVPELARVADLTLLLSAQLAAAEPHDRALAAARAQTDQARLDESRSAVAAAVADCDN